MSEADAKTWEEVFEPHPLPTWLAAFRDAERPFEVLDDLLRRRFYLGNLQLAEPDDLLLDWLEVLDVTDFPERLDGAIVGWLEWRWGDFEVGGAREALAEVWARLLSVISIAEELERSGAWLVARFAEAHDFLGPLTESPSRDPLGLYLAAVARHQPDRRLAPFWWWMCDLPEGVRPFHAIYAVAGIRGLPSASGGFRKDVARAVVRVACAFHRLAEQNGSS